MGLKKHVPVTTAKKIAKPYGVLMIESETESDEEILPQKSKHKKPSNSEKQLRSIPSEIEDEDARRERRMTQMDFAPESESEKFINDGVDEQENEQTGDEESNGSDANIDELDASGSEAEDSGQEDDSRQDQLNRLQKELADISFGQLLQVQQKIGVKKFNKLRQGISVSQDLKSPSKKRKIFDDNNVLIDSSESDEDDDAAPEFRDSKKRKPEIKKRGSKHAPAEITSKKPVSRRRTIVELPKKEIHRDPRFNKLSGNFNEGLFNRSYGFLEEYEKSEIEDLKKRMNSEKSEEQRAQMEKIIQSKISKQIQKQREDRQKNIHRQWKKAEVDAVKNGKKAFYLKKSDKEKLALLEQYKNIKPGQGVDKFLEKRRKKNSATEKRFLPKEKNERK
ncbi:hypothetical protein HK100_001382 [Physocladia obscura]|uniref:rRNA biogenesis protein RRP36 n=1 Tax=Physocladia obscura TaxID=109957 RepID=A0AAD5TAU3_9FUNG|nr:hypothetical protein HK100_001382 [Physocladia obscura]